MDDHYITVGELALLVSIFVGPFILAGGFTQFVLLRQSGLRPALLVGMLVVAAAATLLLTWALMFLVPRMDVFGYGGAFLAPGIIAAIAVSTCVALYARFRRPAVGEPTDPGAVLHLLLSQAGFRQIAVLDSTITVTQRDWRWVVGEPWADSVRNEVREALTDLEFRGRARIPLNKPDLAGTEVRTVSVGPAQNVYTGPAGLTLISFSPLGFSKDSSISVIFWTYYCGALCAGGDVTFFARAANGSWVPLHSQALFRS